MRSLIVLLLALPLTAFAQETPAPVETPTPTETPAPAETPAPPDAPPKPQFQDAVDVVEPELPADPPAQIPVRPEDVMRVAGGAENVFRVIQTLPGVASPDEFSSRLSVRGGGPDENLTILDGVEIHNPYRLFGLVSAFNPETIESFDLAAGAFDARYGDRLSSLLLISARPGTREESLAATAALSVTDANVVAEGRNPIGSGSWLVAGRRTYYDLVAERFTNQDLPSFADLQTKTTFDLGRGRSLKVFGLRSRESADATFDEPQEGAEGAFQTRTRNDLLAVSLTSPFGASLVSRTVASWYENNEEVDFGGNFRNESRRSNTPGDESFHQSRIEVTWANRIRDHAVRQELTWQPGPNRLFEVGFEAHRLETRVLLIIPGERNTQQANTSSLRGGSGLPEDLDSRRADTRIGAWILSRCNLFTRWRIEPGLRFDRSTVNERATLSPRLSTVYSITPSTHVRAAVGLYTQTPGYEKLVQADYFLDLTAEGPLDIENPRARHLLIGVERDLAAGWTARAEGFYKRFDRLVVGRLETTAETAARVGTYDFPAELASSVPREPWITTFPTSGGDGRAYGLDVYLARRATSAATRLSGWASYTYGVAQREAYGLVYPFDYDRRHAVSLVGSWRLSRKLEWSFTARASSGFPRTPVQGLRVADVEDLADRDADGNRAERIPERDAAGNLVWTTDLGGIPNINTARLPTYARVDTRLTFRPRGPSGRLQLYLDVINVLNRKNAGIIDPLLEYDPGSDRPRVREERTAAIPLLPSFGIHLDLSRRRRP